MKVSFQNRLMFNIRNLIHHLIKNDKCLNIPPISFILNYFLKKKLAYINLPNTNPKEVQQGTN